MLKENILASNIIYVSTEHKNDLINKYFQILEVIFEKIKMMKMEWILKNYLTQKYQVAL